MSKKFSLILLLSTTFFFCAVIIGLLIYRSLPNNDSHISAYDQISLNDTIPGTQPHFIDKKLNINAAGFDELVQLPGIGNTLAQRIIDYRESNGAYRTIDDLLKITGIGEAKLSGILDYITVGG